MGKMFFLIVDLIRSKRYGLNSTESNLCSVFNFLLTRKSMNVDGQEYYMSDYDYVSGLCYLLPEKKDTLQRLYKRIENMGLVKIMKIGSHIYINPSEDMRNWGNQFDDIESVDKEKNPDYTEKNPISAEKNPDYTEKNPNSLYIGINKEENNKQEIKGSNKQKEFAKSEFSHPAIQSTKFSKTHGLTKENLNVKQSTIDKIDNAFERLVFPVDDDDVKRMYFVLCCSPKWRSKTINALQMSLNKVQKYDRDFILKLIEDSIAGGWQGLVFENTDAKYQDYIRRNRLGGGPILRQMSDDERKDAMEYLKMIEEDDQY